MPQLKTQQQNPNFILQFYDKQQIAHFFSGKLPTRIIQLTITHGKTTIIKMILQMLCNYNLNGIVTKKEIDQIFFIELSLNFHQY
jgi:hypothetical protein